MRYAIVALVISLTLPLLGGCGQMGPLYMPEEGAQQGKSVKTEEKIPPSTDAS